MKLFAATLALLSFAVVCFTGLLRGADVPDVLKQSLIGMAAGGAVGLMAATAIRYVVREEFDRKYRRKDNVSPDGDADQQTGAGETAETASQTASQES